jgi:large subunit ribosomal protein L13
MTTMKTYRLHSGSMDRAWHVIDAKGVPLGRLASQAAKLLMGKHKPTYEPHLPMGDFVIVVNAKEIGLTGNKATEKVYYRHSGYPGGLRERTFEEQLAKDPRRVVEKAVKRMLPSNALGRELFRHIKVYSGPNHPHAAQVRAGMGAAKRPATSTATTEQSE